MARKRRKSRPSAVDDRDLKRPVITGIIQAVAREIVYGLVYHWWHWGP
jgi:hypothetical protein